MVEKKAAEKKVATKATTATKAKTVKKPAAKKVETMVDAENAGFRAGDVYQALSAAGEALSVAQLASAIKKTETEVLLGIGWLLKEGKVKGDNGKVVLA
ncbi:MAG: winged helix-turn-helix domain-containing protein [Prevotella sp.]|nr:winged helix-turn-helix domain-containing protein [Prevotella sp.]